MGGEAVETWFSDGGRRFVVGGEVPA
jgi:hypothetical protein